MFQQLLKIDSGKTRHHAGSTDRRQTNRKALFRSISCGSGLCGLKLNHSNSDKQTEESDPLQSTEMLV